MYRDNVECGHFEKRSGRRAPCLVCFVFVDICVLQRSFIRTKKAKRLTHNLSRSIHAQRQVFHIESKFGACGEAAEEVSHRSLLSMQKDRKL